MLSPAARPRLLDRRTRRAAGPIVEVDGWRHVEDELRIRCRTTDGARVLLPPAWTDLPVRAADERAPLPALLATAEGWRRFAHVIEGVWDRRPLHGGGWKTVEVAMRGQLAMVIGEEMIVPAAVWETLPVEARTRVTVMLARLLAAAIEEERDE